MRDLMPEVASEVITDKQYHPLPDYNRGVLDCIEGKPHCMRRSAEYKEGYRAQYSREQEESHRSAG